MSGCGKSGGALGGGRSLGSGRVPRRGRAHFRVRRGVVIGGQEVGGLGSG